MTSERLMFKISTAGLAIATISAVLFGCGSKDSSSSSAAPPPPPPPPSAVGASKRPNPSAPPVKIAGDSIKIGMVGSLSGDQKPWGEDSRDGAQMAVDEVNAAGGINGKKIEMEVGDSASKPEPAKAAAEKLLSDGVIAIVGEVASGHTAQIEQSAFQKGVPVMGIGATKTDLSDIGTNFFRVCYTDDLQGPVMAKFAYEQLGLRNVALMTDNKQPYSTGLSKSFRDFFEKLGGKVVKEEFYESNQNQFTSQITELKAANPDGVFLSGYYPEVGPIIQAASQAGIKGPFMGGDGWDSPQLLRSGGSAAIGSYFCNHYNNADSRPEVVQFLKKYRAKFKKLPGTTMAALGYDAMAITLDALKKAKSLDSAALTEAIENEQNFKGVTGDITLKGMNGNPPKRALVVKVQPMDADGNWQKFEKDYTPDQLQTK